jgi:uncharacterized protein with HEPN domain
VTRDFIDCLDDILETISCLEEFTEGMEYGHFLQDKKTEFAVARGLEIIGEACRKISREIQEKYPEIPWNQIAGTRNRLVHEYFRIDWEIVWRIVKIDLPQEKHAFQKIRQELLG